MIVSHSVLLRMRNISDKIWREYLTTHFVFSNFLIKKSCRLRDNVKKYCRTGQCTDDMTHAHCMLGT